VVDERVSRHAGHARHAASAGGTDQPEFHPLELLRPLGGLVGVVGREADGGDGDNQREQQDDGPSDGSAATGQHGSLLTVWQGAAFYRQLAEGSIITAPGRYFIMGDGLMAENRYDAIIIGGGHNGLVSGAYFARSGARTVVLDARHKTGGAADTSAPFPNHPEIKVTTYSYVMSLMPPTIIRELKLKDFGYKVTPFGPYYQAYPDGRAVKVYASDAAKSHASIAQFSKKDADTLPKWEAWLKGVADVLGPLLLQVPPKLGSLAIGDLVASAQSAWKMHKLGTRGVADVTRLFTMSVSDLLDDWFESDAIKAMLTVNGVIGTWAGPDEPGTAYVMLHHSIGDVGDGHLGSWGFQQGGMGGVSDAIRRSAESFGAEIRTDARVKQILVRGGRAVGVALENGEELRAPVVVSCIQPQIAFLDLIERHELPADFVWDIERWKTRSGVVKVNVALSELPDFIANPGKNQQDHHTGSVELCFSPQYAERAFQDAHIERKAAVAPF